MPKQRILESLNETVERSIGCQIGIKYIQNDKKGWLKYIPPGSLHRGKPLILSHYVGALLMVLPHGDYQDLIRGKISVQKYVDESIWHYGYFWGAANIKTGIFWETLEGGKPGIHNTEKIRRYLTMMQCRTLQHHLGEDAFDKARCLKCKQMRCPVSPIISKKAGANLENEFGDHKIRRLEFYKAFTELIKERFDLKVITLFIEEKVSKDVKEIYLAPGFMPKSVRMVISQEMYIDMMYNPENYDVAEMLQNYNLVAATQDYDKKTGEISFGRVMQIGPDTITTDINKFWYNE